MKKSVFDLTHERKGSYKPDGTLYPVLCQRLMPGDVFHGNTEVFGRMMPLVGPTMARFDLCVHYFAVPDRLVWNDFTKWRSPEFIGNVPPETLEYPSFNLNNLIISCQDYIKAGSLMDHFGVQFAGDSALSSNISSSLRISALPFRAYHLIWNYHYRDVDLQEASNIDMRSETNPNDVENMLSFKRRNWEKDYFTSARPFAQKGSPVIVKSTVQSPSMVVSMLDGTTAAVQEDDGHLGADSQTVTDGFVRIDSPFSIADLRWASAYQRFTEKLYRSGTRYKQFLQGFFGVRSSDARLDYPEFIGGGRQPFTIGEVLQTSQSETTPLGTYGGHGMTGGQHSFHYRAEEDCQIIALMSILPRVNYMDTVNKQMIIDDVYDYVIPEFASLGNQEIKNWELGLQFFNEGELTEMNDVTWGYTDRYAQYKFIPSTVHGKMRTDALLQTYHTARKTTDSETGLLASLSDEFINPKAGDSNIARVFAYDMDPAGGNFDPLIINIIHRIKAVRPLPRKSMPGLY